jgi:hypothetical protein
MGSLGVVIALACGAFMAWQRWGATVLASPQYQLTVDAIEVTPQPVWIMRDVKSQVVTDVLLDQLSLLDPQVTIRVARAFEEHPWISKVRRVSKQVPARIVVELDYRQPIVMVEAIGGGFWPVDKDGVLLPPDEFTPNQTRDFLRVFAENAQPAGKVGTSYGDGRVLGAAAIAEVLEMDWRQLNLEKIVARTTNALGRKLDEPEFDLYTRLGTRLVWGRAPGFEQNGEIKAPAKRARLAEHLRSNTASPETDLRTAAGTTFVPRTEQEVQETP